VIKTKQQILNEGRYDSFTREISNDIMSFVKSTSGEESTVFNILPSDEREYTHESGISFNLHIAIDRNNRLFLRGKEYPFFVNTFIDYDNEIYMEITLNSKSEPQSYEKLFYKINEDVRHEVEHYTQDRFKDRPEKEGDSAQYDTTFQHHQDPTEVEALVHGFYRRAKIEKQPLDVVMKRDLDDDVSNGNITQREADILLNKWVNFARRRLPQAIYSNQ
jgi:hypothetical protein